MKNCAKCVCLLLCVVALCSCNVSVPDYFGFQNEDFCAEIQGELGGVEFSATISASKVGGTDRRAVRIAFLSPAEWKGIVISAVMDAEGEVKEEMAELGALSVDMSGGGIEGLLLPVTGLLRLQEPGAIRKEDGLCYLSFSNSKTLTLNADGRPKEYISEAVSFQVIWWEKLSVHF